MSIAKDPLEGLENARVTKIGFLHIGRKPDDGNHDIRIFGSRGRRLRPGCPSGYKIVCL